MKRIHITDPVPDIERLKELAEIEQAFRQLEAEGIVEDTGTRRDGLIVWRRK